MATVAVGLDGREIPPDEQAAEGEPEWNGALDGLRYDIEIFDLMPKWAREAMRDIPKFDVRANDIAPYIVNGTVNRFNIGTMLLQNDAAHRAHFREQDRKNGLA
jgi:hypothetical protein